MVLVLLSLSPEFGRLALVKSLWRLRQACKYWIRQGMLFMTLPLGKCGLDAGLHFTNLYQHQQGLLLMQG